jgi:hypothetical protein
MIDLAVLSGGAPFQWHFVVVLGISVSDVAYHDPLEGPDRHVGIDDFMAAWATAGYRGVQVWTP